MEPADKHDQDKELSMDEAFLLNLKTTVDKNLETKDFGVEQLGKEIGMSRSQIHRKLQSLSGISPSKYIRTRKLQKARDLLQRNVGTVSEISYRLAFSSPAYFSQAYTEEFGYPPSEEQKVIKPSLNRLLDDDRLKGKRKLAAIMFTDIVGYTALMGQDENKGLELLRQNREIQRPLIEQHNGKWLKEMGDGVLAQFDSAYDSVVCALKIQRKAMMGLEAKIRIGIHLGDITIDNEDVFGDGVNIASRLQGIADPGGVYISESIQKALRGRDEVNFEHLGELHLKNVDYLVSTYRLVDDGLPIPSAAKIRQLRVSRVAASGAPLSNINDDLINEVFRELVKTKPSVKHFVEMLEEEDESPDPREMADLIIRNYPVVIGVELRRLFSGSFRSMDRERLNQIFTCIHRTLQFLNFVLTIELYERVSDASIILKDKFKQSLELRFFEITTADCIWVIREINRLLNDNMSKRFIPKLSQSLDDQFWEQLNLSIPPKNTNGEFELDLSEDDVTKECFRYQKKLTFLLKQVSVITTYKLVTIKEIKVLKSRNQEALFEHWMDILNSSNSDYRSSEKTFDTFSDSNAVLLMKSLKQPTEYLNLSPLIIDTRGEVMDSIEKFSLKKDIFVCEGFTNNKLGYAGIEVSEQCDLSTLSNYQQLVKECGDIIKMVNTQTKS